MWICMSAPTHRPSALRLPAMPTSLTHGFSCDDHTHSLLLYTNPPPTLILHYEPLIPSSQAHVQFNGFNKIRLHIKNLSWYSTTDETEIGTQSAINHVSWHIYRKSEREELHSGYSYKVQRQEFWGKEKQQEHVRKQGQVCLFSM